MFADIAKVFIKSGKGGNGHVSFRRELYVPAGGPDGGDGGKGGDIIGEVDKGLNTLEDFRNRQKYIATPGEEGGGKRMHGKNGQDLVIFVSGLNTGEASVEFLKEYNCERYYRYNRELLFDDPESRMIEVLEK